MQPPDRGTTNGAGAKFANSLQRHCLWLLLAVYALAIVWPAPGRAMREWHWNLPFAPSAAVSMPLALLALMLFCAALLTDVVQVRSVSQRPWALFAGLIAVWLVPALLVVVAAVVVPWVTDGPSVAGLLLGLALVASMPVANSSVGWTQLVRGNLAMSLALVLATIFLCPWITPWLLGWLRRSLAAPEGAAVRALVENFSGAFLILWVILPTAAGLACRYLCGALRVDAARTWIVAASVAALLLLNYINAALALGSDIRESPASLLSITVVLAVAMSVVGLAAGWAIARLMRLPPDARAALMFGLSMKHTGLALLVAGTVLANERLAILMIVLATLAQHLVAGIVQWRMR